MAPQLGSGQQHNYSTKTRQAGHANEQSMSSLVSMVDGVKCVFTEAGFHRSGFSPNTHRGGFSPNALKGRAFTEYFQAQIRVIR